MRSGLQAAVVAVLFLSATSCHDGQAQTIRSDLPTVADRSPMENCDGTTLEEKEACYARQPTNAITSCEQAHLYRCEPYKKMHEAEARLRNLEGEADTLADKMYGSREMWDTEYLTDLKNSFKEANATWRSYRDTNCLAEQFYSGISRNEMDDLLEACRLRVTDQRIEEMNTLLEGLKPLHGVYGHD